MFRKEGPILTFLANLCRPVPLGRKLLLVMTNNLTKLRGLQGCCGNHAQPGC